MLNHTKQQSVISFKNIFKEKQVKFIYIGILTITIVSKHLYRNDNVNVSHFFIPVCLKVVFNRLKLANKLVYIL